RPLLSAVDDALDYVYRAILDAPGLGSGCGPLNHFVAAAAVPAEERAARSRGIANRPSPRGLAPAGGAGRPRPATPRGRPRPAAPPRGPSTTAPAFPACRARPSSRLAPAR